MNIGLMPIGNLSLDNAFIEFIHIHARQLIQVARKMEMNMNKEQIEQRIAELAVMEQQLIQKSQADLSAINGAKQDCQFWLVKIEQGTVAVPEQLQSVSLPVITKRGRKKR